MQNGNYVPPLPIGFGEFVEEREEKENNNKNKNGTRSTHEPHFCYPLQSNFGAPPTAKFWQNDDESGDDEEPVKEVKIVHNVNVKKQNDAKDFEGPSNSFIGRKTSELFGTTSGNGATVKMNNKMEEIEKLVEKNWLSDHQDLINFDQCAPLIENDFEEFTPSSRATSKFSRANLASPSNFKSSAKQLNLPKQSIAYDYVRHPLRIVEQTRKFMPLIGELSAPFLRPILIDGIGLIKAYWEGCSEDDEDGSHGSASYFCSGDRSFPIVPIVRCLFYWISRGHMTNVCFPIGFNPVGNRQQFSTSDQDVRSFKQLESLGMALFFEPSANEHSNNLQWFTAKRDTTRGCLITSMAHCLTGMPSSLEQDFNYTTWSQIQMCPERTLQPYFGPRGDLVFFSPISGSRKEFVPDLVLDNGIKTEEEFLKFERYQLRFIEQAKQLRILYDLLPKEKRVLEAHVMVALLERLGPALSLE